MDTVNLMWLIIKLGLLIIIVLSVLDIIRILKDNNKWR